MFSFPVSSRLPHSWLLGSSVSPRGSPAFLPIPLPGFPCIFLGSQYSAFCSFPFVLPGFAPTAVPPVLTFFRLSTSLRCSSLRFPVLSSGSRLGFDYLAFCFFFSLLPVSPHSGSFGAPRSSSIFRPWLICFPLGLLPAFRSNFGTQLFPAIPFSVSLFRLTGATAASDLLFPARSFPLAFALGSGSWAGPCTLKTEHRFLITHNYSRHSLSLRFGQAFGLLVSVSYTHYCASTSDLSTT